MAQHSQRQGQGCADPTPHGRYRRHRRTGCRCNRSSTEHCRITCSGSLSWTSWNVLNTLTEGWCWKS